MTVQGVTGGAPPTPLTDLLGKALGKRLVGVMILAVAVVGAMVFYGDLDAMLESLASVTLPTVALALLLATGNYVIRFARWHYYLHRLDLHIPLAESARIFFAGFSMTVTPGKVGEVLKSVLLRESVGAPVADTLPIIVVERITDLAGLVLLLSVGSLVLPMGKPVAAVSGLLVLAIIVACMSRPLGDALLRVMGRVPALARFVPTARRLYDSLFLLSSPGALFVGVSSSTLAWGLQCLSLYLIVGSFGALSMSLQESLFAYAMPLLAGTVAMLPGGLGVAEASMTGILVRLSSDPSSAAAAATTAALLVRLLTFWWAVLLGFMSLGLWKLHHRPKAGS